MIELEVQQQKDFMERRLARGLSVPGGMEADKPTERIADLEHNVMHESQTQREGMHTAQEAQLWSGKHPVAGDTKASIVMQQGEALQYGQPTFAQQDPTVRDGQAIQHASDHIPPPPLGPPPTIVVGSVEESKQDAFPPGVSRRVSVKKENFFYGGLGVKTDRDAVHLFTAEGFKYFKEDMKTVGFCGALSNANNRSLEIDRRFMHEDLMDVSFSLLYSLLMRQVVSRRVLFSPVHSSRPTDDPGR